jgi:hypothetical protein
MNDNQDLASDDEIPENSEPEKKKRGRPRMEGRKIALTTIKKKRGRPIGATAIPPTLTPEMLQIFDMCSAGWEHAKEKYSKMELLNLHCPEERDLCVEIAVDRLFFQAMKRLTILCASKNEMVALRACTKIADLRIAIIQARAAKNLPPALTPGSETHEAEGWSF